MADGRRTLSREFLLLVPAFLGWIGWPATSSGRAWAVTGTRPSSWAASRWRRSGRWSFAGTNGGAVPITVPILAAAALTVAVGSILINRVPDQVARFALRVTFQPASLLLPRRLAAQRSAVEGQATVAVFLGASVLLALHGLYQYVTNAPCPLLGWIRTKKISAPEPIPSSTIPTVWGFPAPGDNAVQAPWRSPASAPLWRMVCGAVAALLLAAPARHTPSAVGRISELVVGFVALALLAFRPWLMASVWGGRSSGPPGSWRLPGIVSSLVSTNYYLQLSATNGRLYVWRMASCAWRNTRGGEWAWARWRGPKAPTSPDTAGGCGSTATAVGGRRRRVAASAFVWILARAWRQGRGG